MATAQKAPWYKRLGLALAEFAANFLYSGPR